MISRLINMEVSPISSKETQLVKDVSKELYTIEDYARAFIDGMGETQKNRFKKMLENGIQCRFKCCRKL